MLAGDYLLRNSHQSYPLWDILHCVLNIRSSLQHGSTNTDQLTRHIDEKINLSSFSKVNLNFDQLFNFILTCANLLTWKTSNLKQTDKNISYTNKLLPPTISRTDFPDIFVFKSKQMSECKHLETPMAILSRFIVSSCVYWPSIDRLDWCICLVTASKKEIWTERKTAFGIIG